MQRGLPFLVRPDDGGPGPQLRERARLPGPALLNQGGVAIAHATPTDVPTTIRLEQHGLSIGMFYAQVKGPTTGVLTKNNYKITIDVTP